MAINKNHEFEDLNGVKCAIVEKNVPQQRVDFLNDLLKVNDYTVVIVSGPPAKVTATSAAATASEVLQPLPTLFTVGVTDVTFNAVNAIFGRLLKTKDGHVVTLNYWQQKEDISNDEVPYFEKKF